MEVDLGPRITTFRMEMREWIRSNVPEGLSELANWGGPLVAGGRRGAERIRMLDHPLVKEWEARLHDAKLICPQWPREVGGSGWDGVRVAVWLEELRRHNVPAVRRGMGESLVGPAIIVHGTEEQKAYFLPRIIDGVDVYCQGYSEPDHGSDLSAVSTSGVVDGDEVVITGQKVWTSGAQRANMIFVLCRTNPDVPKHRGLSYVLVPFSPANGVRIRPLRQMSGASGFCEDFFDGARAPLFNVIGGLDNGWAPAMTTLGYERGGNATTAHLGFEQEVWELVDLARTKGKAADPLVRQLLAWSYTQVEIMRFAGLRYARRHGEGQGARPGGIGQQAVLERVPQALRRDRHRGRRRGSDGPPRRCGLRDRGVAGHLPLQSLGDDLLRHQRDPEEHHRRACARTAQGTERGEEVIER